MWDPATSLNFRLCKTCQNPQASASLGSFPLSTSSSRTGLVANLRSAAQPSNDKKKGNGKKSYEIKIWSSKNHSHVMDFLRFTPLTSKTFFRCIWRNCAMVWPNCSRKLKNHPSLPQRCLTTKAGHSWPRLAKRRTPRTALENSRCNVTPKEAVSGNKKTCESSICIWVHTYFFISQAFGRIKNAFSIYRFSLDCLKIQWFTVIPVCAHCVWHRSCLALKKIVPPLSQCVATGSRQSNVHVVPFPHLNHRLMFGESWSKKTKPHPDWSIAHFLCVSSWRVPHSHPGCSLASYKIV